MKNKHINLNDPLTVDDVLCFRTNDIPNINVLFYNVRYQKYLFRLDSSCILKKLTKPHRSNLLKSAEKPEFT